MAKNKPIDEIAVDIAFEEHEERQAQEIAAAGGEAQYRAQQIVTAFKFAVAE
jgi:hypothetical protein